METTTPIITTFINKSCVGCSKKIMVDISKKDGGDKDPNVIHVKCIKLFEGTREELHNLKKI